MLGTRVKCSVNSCSFKRTRLAIARTTFLHYSKGLHSRVIRANYYAVAGLPSSKRDLFTFDPVYDEFARGCNRQISLNQNYLLQC